MGSVQVLSSIELRFDGLTFSSIFSISASVFTLKRLTKKTVLGGSEFRRLRSPCAVAHAMCRAACYKPETCDNYIDPEGYIGLDPRKRMNQLNGATWGYQVELFEGFF